MKQDALQKHFYKSNYKMENPRRTILICLSVAIPVGTGIGAAIGATTDNMLSWLATGFAMGNFIGTLIFVVLASRSTEQDEDNVP